MPDRSGCRVIPWAVRLPFRTPVQRPTKGRFLKICQPLVTAGAAALSARRPVDATARLTATAPPRNRRGSALPRPARPFPPRAAETVTPRRNARHASGRPRHSTLEACVCGCPDHNPPRAPDGPLRWHESTPAESGIPRRKRPRVGVGPHASRGHPPQQANALSQCIRSGPAKGSIHAGPPRLPARVAGDRPAVQRPCAHSGSAVTLRGDPRQR